VKFDEYEKISAQTATYPGLGTNLVYPTLGLCGEAGEFAEKVKKMFRDDNSILTEERKAAMVLELGDVLWYLCACARELGVKLSDVAVQNTEKLMNRRSRGTIHGDGDNR
jgi:NTP pyrophosphatase (non-canonical NTP hydrolase)